MIELDSLNLNHWTIKNQMVERGIGLKVELLHSLTNDESIEPVMNSPDMRNETVHRKGF